MRIAIIVACVLASAAAYPQKLKSLKIGDTVPDVEIKSVVNFPSASTNLSFFRNRLLILDFWASKY